MLLLSIIAAPLIGAMASPWLVRAAGSRMSGILLSLVPFSIALALILRPATETSVWSMPWLPALGVDLALKLSGHEALFLLLVSFIGGLILIYGGAYLAGHPHVPRFFLLIQLFMASMLGVILADDLILTFVFWELTSITSFLLIGFKHDDPGARKAALKALLVTGGGGLALLAGLIILSQITGVSRFSLLPEQLGLIRGSALFPLAFFLILLGAFTKSAQIPFHFWLPGAMSAPTPVSAYLHSATMVKAGVILLAKLWPALASLDLWRYTVTPVGAATLLTGAIMAATQTDLKRLLAYSTVSMLGAMTMLLGFGDAFALKTALFLLLTHGLYKASLFMVAGTIDHAAGTRDFRALSGLGRSMPWLAVAGVLAALSMSGVPPTLGFISKELLYEATLLLPRSTSGLIVIAVIASAFGVAVAWVSGARPFFGQPNEREIHRPERGLVLPPLILALLGIIPALFPSLLDRGLISPAVASLGGAGPVPGLSLWHGFTPVLGLSALTLLLGFIICRWRHALIHRSDKLAFLSRITPTALYHTGWDRLLRCATLLTGWIQHGQLRIYVRVILIAAAVLILQAVLLSKGNFSLASTVPVRPFELMVVLMMGASAIAAARSQSRLSAILSLGGVGYSVAMLFTAYGAPDLAITQLLVETLTVVLFSFVILKLPQIRIITKSGERFWDVVIASAAGVAMTLVVWKSVHVRVHDSISPGLVERSATEAYGLNVVNVILIDFRALDTLGEITVLALACLGVTALISGRKRGEPKRLEIATKQEGRRETP